MDTRFGHMLPARFEASRNRSSGIGGRSAKGDKAKKPRRSEAKLEPLRGKSEAVRRV